MSSQTHDTSDDTESQDDHIPSAGSLAVVIGGTGFLGGHLCATLSGLGWRVRVLSRSGRAPSCAPPLPEGEEIEYRAVDVLDSDALLVACADADAVYHLAGRVSREPKDTGALCELHIRGTQSFIRVVEELKLERALYLSTSGVVGVSKGPEEHTEEAPYARDIIGDWGYYQSKLFAEEEVMRACARGLPIKIARPSLFLGPDDPTGQSHEDVLLFLGGKLKAVPPGGLNAVDVRDVATFLPRLIERGEPGVGYLIGGDNLTARAFINQVAQITDREPPLLDLTTGLVDRAMGPLKWISSTSLGGGIAPQTFEMGRHFWYINSAAARALGFTPRPLSQTLLDALRDLESRGFY